MTEEEIRKRIQASNTSTATPWNTLLNAYIEQLAAVSRHVPDEALDALIHLGAACHRKAYAELAASEQTELALHKMKVCAVSLARSARASDPYSD